jgi:hypothetical protein
MKRHGNDSVPLLHVTESDEDTDASIHFAACGRTRFLRAHYHSVVIARAAKRSLEHQLLPPANKVPDLIANSRCPPDERRIS